MSKAGTIVRVNPGELIVAANVRANTKVTKEFVASVKLHGVLVPITARETDDGLAVVDGQRRTLAAVQAGVEDVPVFVVELADEAQRIVDQVVVNEHREDLDDVEQVLALKELEQLGVSAAAIARRTGTKRKAVDAALVVAASESTTSAMRERALTFDDAIVLAEFDGDDEATSKLLEVIADGRGVEHTAQRLRNERHIAAKLDEVRAEIVAQGLASIDAAPRYDDKELLDLAWVDAKRGGERLEVTDALRAAPDDVFAFPKHESGLGHWDGGEYVREDDRFEIGYAVRRSALEPNGWWHYSLNSASSPAEQTPEEREAARKERRRARESTKAWKDATVVRLRWVRELLQRRTMPKQWEALSVRQSLTDLYGYPWGTVLDLLQVERSEGGLGKYDVVTYVEAHPAKAPQVALALAIGSIEGAREFDRNGWRHESAKPYLELLSSWGYELSDVEREVLGETAVAA